MEMLAGAEWMDLVLMFAIVLSLVLGAIAIASLPMLWKRPVAARMPRKAELSPEEMGIAFANGVHHPMYGAMVQLMDEEIARLTELALNPRLSDGETKFHMGGCDALLNLRIDVENRRIEAMEAETKGAREPA